MADWATALGGHGREPDRGSIADGADRFQCHVTRALGGPFVGLLEENDADEPNHGGLVRKVPD